MPQETKRDNRTREAASTGGSTKADAEAARAVWGVARPVVIAGPCAVESREQMATIAAELSQRGLRVLRAGAFKARTEADSFQGLREEGIEILRAVGTRCGMLTISEVLDCRQVEFVARRIDILQVGSRNMYDYELLKEIAQTGKPVLLKRSFMATLDEFAHAAEYLLRGGGEVALCERGIRTFEPSTRNTLDIMAVPIMQRRLGLPVFVDVSHSTGQRELVIPAAKASLAVGADGIMVEVHPEPDRALSDAHQQLSVDGLVDLLSALRMNRRPVT